MSRATREDLQRRRDPGDDRSGGHAVHERHPLDDLDRSPEAHEAPERGEPRIHAEDDREGGRAVRERARWIDTIAKGEASSSRRSPTLPVAIICDMMGVPE
jgi:hypothetical protein